MGTAFADEAEVDLFGVVDTLVDPEAFYAFRQSPDAVESLGDFYDELNASTAVTALSVFDQRVSVQDFRGGDEFDPATVATMRDSTATRAAFTEIGTTFRRRSAVVATVVAVGTTRRRDGVR